MSRTKRVYVALWKAFGMYYVLAANGGCCLTIMVIGARFIGVINRGLIGGHRNDITQAAELLKEQHDTMVLADKGYDSQKLIDNLHKQDCSSVMLSRKYAKEPREIDKELYKERFLIEAFFSELKLFRRNVLDLITPLPLFLDFYIWPVHSYGCARNFVHRT